MEKSLSPGLRRGEAGAAELELLVLGLHCREKELGWGGGRVAEKETVPQARQVVRRL